MGTTAEKLTKLSQTKSAIKTAIEAKGVTVGDVKFADYPEKIGQIQGGGGGEKKYGMSIGDLIGDPNADGILQPPAPTCETLDFSGIKGFADGIDMQQKFTNTSSLKNVYFGDLEQIYTNANSTFYITFQNCTNLSSVDFSSLHHVGRIKQASQSQNGKDMFSSTFKNCTSLSSVDFSSLTSIASYHCFYGAFDGCPLTEWPFKNLQVISADGVFQRLANEHPGTWQISSMDFDSLTTVVGGDTFQFMHGFALQYNTTVMKFPALETIDGSGFLNYMYGIQKVYMPRLTNLTQNNMFNSTCSVSELHFSTYNQDYIMNHPGYATCFGRGAGQIQILFDPI